MGFFSFSLFATLLARVWLTVGRTVGRVPFLAIVALFVHFGRRSQNPLHSIPFRFRYDVYERTFLGAFLSSLNNSGCYFAMNCLVFFFFFLHCHCSDRSGDCTWVLMYAMFLSMVMLMPMLILTHLLHISVSVRTYTFVGMVCLIFFAAIITKDILSFRIYHYMSMC
ncbi:hypothetical protein BO83DRAFT_6564 [Aspergillus eucalypticola CBS 122712]|uniref:Uncharacterized protein n=1 Tax=Aspergillus eucalypticola (strain CBS 122712 / IBT 29274) TaxID=1448314 RepID=A0A317WGF2_ASPEC|nr:uncharacterized protein BO83DRAFT_6564 [Aspergillus eucalypticola CBS 122712]PWY85379.1 hypothetical protein BO83DRAFT_6564 [Aspergillus eucalypticola CBS 122712]